MYLKNVMTTHKITGGHFKLDKSKRDRKTEHLKFSSDFIYVNSTHSNAPGPDST